MKKEIKLNNRGFTLIEVLAVIVILVIIVAIAIPNISASLDRQTCKTTENKAKLIESAAQFYVSDNRNTVIDQLDGNGRCRIVTNKLKGIEQDDKKYIINDDLIDGDNKPFSGYVVYNRNEETYTFCFDSEKDFCDLNKEQKDASKVNICTNDYVDETETCY